MRMRRRVVQDRGKCFRRLIGNVGFVRCALSRQYCCRDIRNSLVAFSIRPRSRSCDSRTTSKGFPPAPVVVGSRLGAPISSPSSSGQDKCGPRPLARLLAAR